MREVAGDPEDDEAARVRVAHAAERRGHLVEARQAADGQALVVAVPVGRLIADVRLRRLVALAGKVRPVAHSFSCTAWPPNSLRRAASTLPENVSSCRERKRMNRAAEMAGIGTECWMACSTVQRPSPVSST